MPGDGLRFGNLSLASPIAGLAKKVKGVPERMQENLIWQSESIRYAFSFTEVGAYCFASACQWYNLRYWSAAAVQE